MRLQLLVGASALALCLVAPVMAAEAPAPAADAINEITVYGRGQTRQVQTIQAVEISAVAPGTSALKVLSKLPGVNYQAADAFGAYEWALRISVRGFNQNQLGFTLDDVPLGDMSYGNNNGLHISRAIISENIGNAQMAQGSGSLETASSSNLGGSLKFSSIDPSTKFGVLTALTAGSDNTQHAFVRLESGEVATGGRGYLSYSNQSSEKWKGYGGKQKQWQINSKFVQPLGNVTLTAFFNMSDRAENDYQDVSLEMINRLGYNIDNIANNYELAKQIAYVLDNRWAFAVGNDAFYAANPNAVLHPEAGYTFPAPYTSADDVYFDASGLRNDTLGGGSINWDISKDLSAKATYYRHTSKGAGPWYTPYTASPGGSPISERMTEYHIDRQGLVASMTYELGAHTIEGGVWTENNDFHQARRYYALGLDSPGVSSLKFRNDAFYTSFDVLFNTRTTDFHLQDTWKITDALKANFGFKTVNVVNKASPLIPGSVQGTIKVDEGFLPQVGVNYDLGSAGEVFASYAENVRAFSSAVTGGPFSTNQAGFDAIKDTLKPETSKTYEAGYRYHNDQFEGVLAVYHVNFADRLLATKPGAAIVDVSSVLANVGGVTSDGFEAAGTWHFRDNWSAFGSYSYNKSTYDSDVYDGDHVLVASTGGKSIVDAPKNMLKGELNYDDGQLFGKLGASFVDKRFYTYTADASVKAYTVADLSIGYRFKSDNTTLNGLEVQANVTNLFDNKYVSTVGSAGYANSDPEGTGQTLMVGAPRQAFVTVRKQF